MSSPWESLLTAVRLDSALGGGGGGEKWVH